MVSLVAKTGALISLNRNGRPPIWSSCPWVSIIAFTLFLFFLTYEKSGIIKSIPGISSSGNIIPQSTIII
ncbi:hypothetical protein ES708_17568 [subsurface metagenome]